ncbi:MAG: DUF3696 domain-containing protein [Leptospiraceae bacterium]|nr:DUF3696 domain-containing protein [Leptospiraceae bacterium]MCP5494385.1 DUF3696 domain-containing protein [Leptospiraceae bacterium]
MIKAITLTGFKSFVSDYIELRNLTLLTGLNSSGKSSVIQSLLMGNNAASNKEILLDGHGDWGELKNSYSKETLLEYDFTDDASMSITKSKVKKKGKLSFPKIIHIAADRLGPETSNQIYGGNNYSLGKKGENVFKVIDYYSENYDEKKLPSIMVHEDSQGETFGYNLEAWLGIISPNTKFQYQMLKQADTSFSTFNGYRAKNVGFGLSYSLPIIVALLVGSITENSLVILENPEAHLHPRGQTEMARLISLCAESGSQVIVETHSDYIFDGVRVYTKKNKTNFHEKVIVHWFELNKEKNTEPEFVRIDKNGRVEEWPKGMFDQFEINSRELLRND